MKTDIVVKKEIDVKYLQADFNVRYFEDSIVNGKNDDAEHPSMPCMNGNCWSIEIDIDEGRIINWKAGNTAIVRYKVCDEGSYRIYDEKHNLILDKEDYVPSILSQDGNGYGDYVLLTIETDGKIKNWNVNHKILSNLLKNGFDNEED